MPGEGEISSAPLVPEALIVTFTKSAAKLPKAIVVGTNATVVVEFL